VKSASTKIAFIIAITMMVGACSTTSATSSYKSTLKNKSADVITYCESHGGPKVCQQMHKGQAMQRVNQFLNSPRARM